MPTALRVLMFPGVGNANENRYIDILVRALRARNVDVKSFRKEIELRPADIFHVHWPELITDIRARPWQKLRSEIIKSNFFRTIDRVQKNGGAVVWTVHNLSPHRSDSRLEGFNSELMKRFSMKVDGVLSLTESGLPQIKSSFPDLKQSKFFVTPHPHYRNFGAETPISGASNPFKVGSGGFVFGLLGNLRPNKKALELIRAFKAAAIPNSSLLIAGAASEPYASALRAEAASISSISLVLRRLTEDEMRQAYAGIDAVIFPSFEYFNSGTVLTALSHNVAVLAAETPTNLEIQEKVGSAWLSLFSSEHLGPKHLVDMRERRKHLCSDRMCDLSSFDPDYVGLKTRNAYEALLMR